MALEKNQPLTSGLMVENAILLALSKITEAEAEESFEYGHQAVREMRIHRELGDIAYPHVVDRVGKMLAGSRWEPGRNAVPIHRALCRLQAKGKLTLTWYANRRIGSVRLSRELTVAMKAK